MMSFGCIAAAVAATAFDDGSVSFIVDLGGTGTHWLFSLVIIFGVIAVNVLNLYGIFMCTTTTVAALAPRERRNAGPARRQRFGYRLDGAAGRLSPGQP